MTCEEGIWIGIDLGTSNCTVAIWDVSQQRAKLVRFPNCLSKRMDRNGKMGRMIPTAFMFANQKIDDEKNHQQQFLNKNSNVFVGYEAYEKQEEKFIAIDMKKKHQSRLVETNPFITSAKRIWGMTHEEIQDELSKDKEFLNRLPFEVKLIHDPIVLSHNYHVDGDRNDNTVSFEDEGARIRIRCSTATNDKTDKKNGKTDDMNYHWIEPLQLVTILLTSIRTSVEDFLYVQRHKLNPLGVSRYKTSPVGKETYLVQNCVLGVPAYYSRNQRQKIVFAAKKAGFKRVETIIESTAAAMAYGLFVSIANRTANTTPHALMSSCESNESISSGETHRNNNCEQNEDTTQGINSTPMSSLHVSNGPSTQRTSKFILVFDMGGGTTDVTITQMAVDDSDDNPTFQVVATVGDKHLGGDDMDECLVGLVSSKLNQSSQTHSFDFESRHEWKEEHALLRQLCRKAKEELCGNTSWKDGCDPASSVSISWKGNKVTITQEEFCNIIAPLVLRARDVLNEALTDARPSSTTQEIIVDEVVLVGGASRTPSIRNMLRSRFPPPHPPDLCCSIQGEAAVAYGAAIQAAVLSGLVPKHELRNALMLDALPHTLGIMIPTSNHDKSTKSDSSDNYNELYVPILHKNSPLPAKGSATFTLADICQRGITVTVVEDVGDDWPLQRIGEFNFLLHRLSEDDRKRLMPNGVREVDVGIIAETDGTLIVTYFDANDPEHMKKKSKFSDAASSNLKIKNGNSSEQIFLFVSCIILFIFYVTVKLSFHEANQSVR